MSGPVADAPAWLWALMVISLGAGALQDSVVLQARAVPVVWQLHPDPMVRCWWQVVYNGVHPAKPHNTGTGQAALLAAQEAGNGTLALSQFRRLKQLGAGDVGLVDLVQLSEGSDK